MNQNMKEIREMQDFLGVQHRPGTLYKMENYTCGFEEWLEGYRKKLEEACARKLVEDEELERGRELFLKKFSHFQKG